MTDVKKHATLSPDGRYRYELRRTWDAPKPAVTFVMLNPSTADASEDDATVRKCMGFARRWNRAGIIIVNLFAYRARHPAHLLNAIGCGGALAAGPENARYLAEAIKSPANVLVAWGGHKATKQAQAEATKRMLATHARREPERFGCLGFTRGGEPRHPLMLAYDTHVADWPIGNS